ncbi:SpaA isopeptide-forming pilin-related protein [Corynebacterium marquesiae]|uniref:SpaA isopeptide-forming pilin-related protein n=1 Tax=Corynebacterium marquesiae TaxID=2913503 RepID=UPI00255090F7|nr:SpaA isopeptide-forming pilin-related protein [Corynebacterium marquesiae]MDK8455313.1 SpaA isopeptide-forming pilin-related protein [Corynebacterium marquesiae]MDK8725414.1 SpaA isopeptide-forming pilin-related protein [Corynebacterium marquesiae]MDK8770750.1 SpaA isopeptide-forming pilin-related protein [Corynebacterium marquesiae]
MKTKFMGVAAALTAALALVFGVAIPGALPSLPAPVAQAQTTAIPVSPQKRDFKDLDTRKYNPPFEFTVEEDATITSLDFQIGGSGWLKAYELKVGNTTLSPKISPSGSAQQAPLTVTHDGLNIAVKKGEIIRISPYFTAPKVSGTVSVSPKGTLSGSTPPPTEPNPEPQPDPEPTPEPNPGASVTPAAPTAVDPATAPSCVEKGYINIPDTKGVDYFIGGERKQAGQHFYEGKKATVKVTAKPQNGYQFAAGAKTEWSFDFSGEVKDCSDSSEDPKPPAVEGRHFDAIGHEFAVKADPVDPTKPNAFTAKVTAESHMKYATVRIETDATFLDPQKYNLTLDQIEPGVTLQKRNVNIGNGFITMDVVPVKDGKPVDSAVVPKDAVFTFTNNLSENKNLKVVLDVYGANESTPKPPEIISPPDGAQWVNGRVPNPELPLRCGLRIAVVADLSTSLRYADTDGFEASKKAANAFIDSLQGTPAELGIYNFASSGPANQAGTTHGQNPPYISMQSEQGVQRAKDVVNNWSYNGNNSATNWEAGLKQVKEQDYDVVYFITDGMPTTSSTIKNKGIGGEFVQASALNDAIKAANELKAAGTRVVPIMVDLTLGGRSGQRPVVQNDLVLKDAKRIGWTADPGQAPGLYYKIRSDHPKALHANYINTDTLANLKMAYDAAGSQALQVFERMPNGRSNTVTSDMSRWTYGARGVETMGEDISGTGDTVRVSNYSNLAEQMKTIAQDVTTRCNGVVTVKKRIVDENGKVLEDGAPGWEFTLSTGGQDIIDPGNGELVRRSLKATSSADRDLGTASWNIMSEQEQQLTLVETQQPGFNLYKRNDKNAVCTETRDGVTKPVEVTNDGEFGFKVKMSEKDKKLSSVSCVVDNYKQPETPPGKLTFKKAQYDGDKIVEMSGLGGATFKIYPSKGGQPDYSAGELYTIKPGQESIEVKTTGTFFLVETKAPKGLNLLAQPVEFQISVDEQTKQYKISAVSTSSGQIQVSGQGDKMILQVADTTAGKLPKTGGYGVALVGLIGAVLAGAGLLLGRRKTT